MVNIAMPAKIPELEVINGKATMPDGPNTVFKPTGNPYTRRDQ